MKKLLTLSLVIFLICSTAFAECNTVLPAEVISTYTYHSNVDMVLTATSRVVGIKSLEETKIYLPMTMPHTKVVAGIVDNGILRKPGLAKYLRMTDTFIDGLTSIPATVTIDERYYDLVYSIVTQRLNVENICAKTIISATYWTQDNHIGHIFYLTNERTAVGTVYFSNSGTVTLYAGDIDKDGNYELGFAAGWIQINPEPPKPVNTNTNTNTNKNCKSGCTKINVTNTNVQNNTVVNNSLVAINFIKNTQINFNNTIINAFNKIFKSGCPKKSP